MKKMDIGIVVKYTLAALAGCTLVAVAVESLSSKGKNDVPVLTASHSTTSSTVQSVISTSTSTLPSSSSASSSAPLSSSSQSSTSVSSPVTSETPEPPEPAVSVDEPPETILDSPDSSEYSAPQSVPTESTFEQSSEPVSSSTSSKGLWELTDEEWEKYLQGVSGVIQSSTDILSSSTSTIKPPVSTVEPPAQSSEPPVSSTETSSPLPDASNIPGFVIVNINTATVSELTQLEGIGEERALAIIAFREQFGGFTSIYEIREVEGIGDTTFEKIRDFIVI